MKLGAHENLLLLASEARTQIINALGEDVVRAIFVSGSVVRLETAWFNRGGTYEIYSDVDIFVVVEDDAAWEESRRLARRAIDDIERVREAFELIRPIDVGVFVLSDLLAQPARPGTVDIARSHYLLYGDAEIPKMMAHISSASIDPSEGLYLLENRMIEKAELFERIHVDDHESLKRYAVYAAHKTCVDVGTAALIVAKRYCSEPVARRKTLRVITGDTAGDCLLTGQDLTCIEKSVQAIKRIQRGQKMDKKPYDSVWLDIEPFILQLWRRLSARVLKTDEDADWSTLISKRCQQGDTLNNIRSFSLLARRRKFGKARSVVTGAVNRRFSPIDALRLSGLVQSVLQNPQAGADDQRLAEEFVPYLDRITRILGHGEGDVFTRARKLYRELN
jgi:hypothetical protein